MSEWAGLRLRNGISRSVLSGVLLCVGALYPLMSSSQSFQSTLDPPSKWPESVADVDAMVKDDRLAIWWITPNGYRCHTGQLSLQPIVAALSKMPAMPDWTAVISSPSETYQTWLTEWYQAAKRESTVGELEMCNLLHRRNVPPPEVWKVSPWRSGDTVRVAYQLEAWRTSNLRVKAGYVAVGATCGAPVASSTAGKMWREAKLADATVVVVCEKVSGG